VTQTALVEVKAASTSDSDCPSRMEIGISSFFFPQALMIMSARMTLFVPTT